LEYIRGEDGFFSKMLRNDFAGKEMEFRYDGAPACSKLPATVGMVVSAKSPQAGRRFVKPISITP
jgi:hypothetical protein